MMQEGMTPVFRKRFGDGLVTMLRGKDKSAENMKDVRRAVAAIMYSGREAKVEPYGGIDAWKASAPAFEGDPIAAAGAETGEKEACAAQRGDAVFSKQDARSLEQRLVGHASRADTASVTISPMRTR